VLSSTLLLLVQDGRSLQHSLSCTRAALKQADVRIAILDDRNCTLQQVGQLLAVHLQQPW
jgi:hypothetical protein